MNKTTYRRIHYLVFAAGLSAVAGRPPAFAQKSEPSPSIAPADLTHGDEFLKLVADYSRPGKYHLLLADMEGSWKFKVGFPDAGNAVYHGTIVWRSFANGRFLIAETEGNEAQKLQMPIQDGKWSETIYRGVSIIGYDNVKKKFQLATIGNHFGSDITFSQGDYDEGSHSIVFEAEEELAPNKKTMVRHRVMFFNKDHYALREYELKDGSYVQTSETDYTR